MTPRLARRGECVAAIASFCQRVGTEAETDFAVDDVVDDGGVFPRVEVVDQLRALVSEKPGVLELHWTLHVPKSSGTRLERVVTSNGPTDERIASRLSELARNDAALGERAEAHVARYRAANGITEEIYAFPTYRSAEERKVWVHKWWVRPIRFFYRHLPRGIRSRIKKVAT
jgi:hypothetical protein